VACKAGSISLKHHLYTAITGE